MEINTKISPFAEYQELFKHSLQPIEFAAIPTERFVWACDVQNENELFTSAFLLGVIQSPLYEDEAPVALTHSKKLFIITSKHNRSAAAMIAIVNEKTGNVFIGPDNGLGISFFKDYLNDDIKVFNVSTKLLEAIKRESNNEMAYSLIKQQPLFKGRLEEVNFLGSEEELIRDSKGRPKILQARIWIDLYGNIKTTVQSTLLNEAKECNAQVKVILNGIGKPVIFAETFSQAAKRAIAFL